MNTPRCSPLVIGHHFSKKTPRSGSSPAQAIQRNFTAPPLPPELIDHVIDELWNDTRSLRICTLVCNSWRISSQWHLFQRIHVGLVGEQETSSDRRLDEYRRFLLSSNRRSIVRELRIYRPTGINSPLTCAELFVLLHYTPSLRKLTLQGINLRTTTERDFDKALPFTRLPSVRTLDISGYAGSFWSCGSRCLFEMLTWFPELRTLRIRMGALLNSPNCPPSQSMELMDMDQHLQYIRIPTSVRPLRLTHFHFDSPLSRPFLVETLRKTGCYGSLTTITVGLSSMDEIVASGRLFRDVGPRLLHLRLNLIDTMIQDGGIVNGTTQRLALDALQLERCTSLRSIRLDLPYGYTRRSVESPGFVLYQPAHHWSFGYAILRRFATPSHRLQSATFVFMHQPQYPVPGLKRWTGSIQEIDWTALNECLERLVMLEEVRFYAEDRWGTPRHKLWPKVTETITRAVLPSIIQRGISLLFVPDEMD